MKLTVVGSGSTYTPELVSGLARDRDGLDVHELVLHDIDAERRDVVGAMARRMLDKQGFRGRLTTTDDVDRAVDGADFVLIQIRVGGQAARLRDETVPLACGCIGQETTGAGGFAKAMRTVPVVLEPERILVDQVGLNHLTWVRAVWLDGRDVLPELLAERGEELAAMSALPRS